LSREDAPPTTLLFDLSEVLIAGLRGVEKGLAQRLEHPEDEILRLFAGDSLRRLCRGEISEDGYLHAVAVALAGALEPDELRGIVRSNFHQEVPGMRDLVCRLEGVVDLVLVSDHAREWIAYIEDVHPFLDLFERRVYSFETRLLKDDPGAFDEILRRVERAADACLFIDDNPRNVATAEAAGIRAVRFEGREALEVRLRELGIQIPRG
jgi:2-haloacid dehalogenase